MSFIFTFPTRLAVYFVLICALSAPARYGQAGGIEGVVTGPDQVPLPAIEVNLFQLQGPQWQYVTWQNTGDDGSYVFADLDDGTYTLLFRDWAQTFAYSYYGGVSRLEDATAIEIAGGTSTADASLDLAGRIAGTLTDPGGRPLDYPLIFVYTAAEEPELLFLTNPDATSGAYEIGGLPTGDYLIWFTGRQGLDSYSVFYDGAPSIDEATPIKVIVGETTTGIDGQLGLPPGGVIEGRITDPYGRAFDFAAVDAFAWIDDQWVLAGSDETVFYESEFRLPLAPGSYRLRFEAGSFLQPELPAVEFFDDVLQIEDGADVAVELDQTIAGFDIVVGDLSIGSISGTVTDEVTGAPLAGIQVYAADRKGRVLWDQIAVTDTAGAYTVSGLWPEAYFIEFYDPDFVYPTVRLPDRILVDEGAVAGVDGALTPAAPGSLPGSISGTVSSPAGEPLRGIQVTAEGLSGSTFATAVTDPQGHYRLRDLPADGYLLRFTSLDGFRVPEWYDDVADRDDALAVAVLDGADTGGVDAELAPAGVITGSITDRFGSDFFISTATAFVWDGSDWQQVANTGMAYESDYRLDGVPVGVVRVLMTGRRGTSGSTLIEVYDDVGTLEEGTDVPVVFGQVTAGIDAVLGSPPPGAIAGQVTDGAGGDLGDIEVRVYDDSFELEAESLSQADGTYEVSGLYNGIYYVAFSDPAGVYPSEVYNDVPELGLGTPIEIVDGAAVTGIDAALDGTGGGPGGGGMRGVVTDDTSGLPVAGIEVRCVAEDFSFIPDCETTTAVDGSYQLAGFLPAGQYHVSFRSDSGEWVDEWYDDVPRPQDATPVTVFVGSWTDGIDAALAPAGGIAGTVTNEVGNAFPLLTVTALLWNGSDWQPYKSSFTIDGSAYELLGLPAGDYRVRFRGSSLSDPNGGIVEFYDDVQTVEEGTDVTVTVGQVTSGIDAVLGNLGLQDPGFDHGIEPWTLEVPAGSTVRHGQIDRHGDPESGSAEVLHRTGPGERLSLSQCVMAVGGQTYLIGGWLRVAGGSGNDPRAYATIDFHADPGCGDSPLDSADTPPASGSQDWTRLAGTAAAPAAATSARVGFVLDAGQAAGFDAHWDQLFFEPLVAIFADGFESGSFERWSTAVAGP